MESGEWRMENGLKIDKTDKPIKLIKLININTKI